jgi:hypothetical protein
MNDSAFDVNQVVPHGNEKRHRMSRIDSHVGF